ncbi:Ger(x)C family spore germination protein [Paenibacillus hamazuiensis]|uniref:Ger(x)C family spore germination protein n=1 Tax=Paenibacillus hamazuiensis TaxID=2936508 RepID=UPI00200F3570|nr:Ger(x)C family spore germination protein [Paenibacillus hamazuiensis]
MNLLGKARSLALAAVCLTVLPGCWDRTETNDLAFVLSSSVDKEKDGTYRFAMMFPLPGQLGGAKGGGGGTSGDKSYYTDSDVGSTVREAQAKVQKRLARRAFFAHRRTLLIGEDAAKDGIGELFDAITRTTENRLTSYMVICKGKGYDMLKANPKFERFPAEAFRELAKSKDHLNLDMKDVGMALASAGGDPVIPYMGIKESEKSEKPSKEVQFLGYAIFKNDKLVETMGNDAAEGLQWLLRSKAGYTVTIPVENTRIMTLKLFEGNTEIRPSLKNGSPHFAVKVQAKAKLLESKSFYDLSRIDNVRKVEAAVSSYIKKSIQNAAQIMQRTGTDPAQLGTVFYRKYPAVFQQQFAGKWHDAIKEATFDIEVTSYLSDNGLIYENLSKAGKGE